MKKDIPVAVGVQILLLRNGDKRAEIGLAILALCMRGTCGKENKEGAQNKKKVYRTIRSVYPKTYWRHKLLSLQPP